VEEAPPTAGERLARRLPIRSPRMLKKYVMRCSMLQVVGVCEPYTTKVGRQVSAGPRSVGPYPDRNVITGEDCTQRAVRGAKIRQRRTTKLLCSCIGAPVAFGDRMRRRTEGVTRKARGVIGAGGERYPANCRYTVARYNGAMLEMRVNRNGRMRRRSAFMSQYNQCGNSSMRQQNRGAVQRARGVF